jgi:hypothetical protein
MWTDIYRKLWWIDKQQWLPNNTSLNIQNQTISNLDNILDPNYLNSANFVIGKKLLSDNIQSWNITWIANLLMEILTSRPEFLKEKYWKDDPNFLIELKERVKIQSDYYKNVIFKIEKQCKKDWILEITDNPAWFSLKTKSDLNNINWWNYKIYLTIPINWYDYVSKIYQLWLMLNILAENTWDKISLKVPNSILWFLSHSDSIVIHFKNFNNKENIEGILNKWKIKNWVIEETRNLWRTKFAWDSSNDSFSGLIADNIKKWILENYWKYDNELIANLAIEYAIKQSQIPPKFN